GRFASRRGRRYLSRFRQQRRGDFGDPVDPMMFRTIFTVGAIAAVAPLPSSAQTPAMKPGVTVWLYETGEEMRELPVLVDGQTPNVSNDYPAVDFSDPRATTYDEPLTDRYYGHAWGS